MAVATQVVDLPVTAFLQDYAVHMILPTGGVSGLKRNETTEWNITELVTSLSWTDSFDQPAVQLDLTISAALVKKDENPSKGGVQGGKVVDVRSMVACGCGIRVWAAKPLPSGKVLPLKPAKLGRWDKKNELFRGYVFDITRAGAPAGDELQLVCYDTMVYASKNDHDAVYKNKTASFIIRDLLEDIGIKIHPTRFLDIKTKVPRLVTNGMTVYDACNLALQKTRLLTKSRYRLRMEGGYAVLFMRDIKPDEAWLLRAGDSLISSSRAVSIQDLVTSAEIKSDGKSGRITELKGSTKRFQTLAEARYGRMHRIIDRGSEPADKGKDILDTFLKENGRPSDTLSVSIPCINSLRAGDYVKVVDPDTGYDTHLWVDSVSHSVTAGSATTDLTLVKRIEEADVEVVDSEDGESTTTRWVAERDGKNRPIRYRMSIQVYTPVSTNTQQFSGDEDVATVEIGGKLVHTVGKRIKVAANNTSLQVAVTGTHPSGFDVRLSTHAAQRLGLTTGEKAFVSPLRAITTGGGASGTAGGPDTTGSPTTYDTSIREWGGKFGVAPALIKAIMKAESAFSPSAHSGAGAQGLMQVMPATAAGLGWSSREGALTEPNVSIKYGAKYIGQLQGRFRKVEHVIAAYNAGPGAVQRYGGIPPFAETQAYVPKVMGYYQAFLQAGFS